MLTGLWAAPSQGGTSNYWRLHHVVEGTAPSRTNMIVYAIATERAAFVDAYAPVKAILGPGDSLYAHLQSGTAVTVTGYGLVPRNA